MFYNVYVFSKKVYASANLSFIVQDLLGLKVDGVVCQLCEILLFV